MVLLEHGIEHEGIAYFLRAVCLPYGCEERVCIDSSLGRAGPDVVIVEVQQMEHAQTVEERFGMLCVECLPSCANDFRSDVGGHERVDFGAQRLALRRWHFVNPVENVLAMQFRRVEDDSRGALQQQVAK